MAHFSVVAHFKNRILSRGCCCSGSRCHIEDPVCSANIFANYTLGDIMVSHSVSP